MQTWGRPCHLMTCVGVAIPVPPSNTIVAVGLRRVRGDAPYQLWKYLTAFTSISLVPLVGVDVL